MFVGSDIGELRESENPIVEKPTIRLTACREQDESILGGRNRIMTASDFEGIFEFCIGAKPFYDTSGIQRPHSEAHLLSIPLVVPQA